MRGKVANIANFFPIPLWNEPRRNVLIDNDFAYKVIGVEVPPRRGFASRFLCSQAFELG